MKIAAAFKISATATFFYGNSVILPELCVFFLLGSLTWRCWRSASSLS
jgi:hypothetical protein